VSLHSYEEQQIVASGAVARLVLLQDIVVVLHDLPFVVELARLDEVLDLEVHNRLVIWADGDDVDPGDGDLRGAVDVDVRGLDLDGGVVVQELGEVLLLVFDHLHWHQLVDYYRHCVSNASTLCGRRVFSLTRQGSPIGNPCRGSQEW
jgi:hypothetical protein